MMNPYCGRQVTIIPQPIKTLVVVREEEYASWPVIVGRATVYLGLLAFSIGFWVAAVMLVHRAVSG